MKTRFLVGLATVLLISGAHAAVYVDIPGVYGTGLNVVGSPLANGQPDPHYTITASPNGPTSAYATSPFFMWTLGETATSRWINPNGAPTDSPVGDYVFTLTFSLAGLDYTTASIMGNWASDNNSFIYLNGQYTGLTRGTDAAFFEFASFTLNSGFVDGINTLSFVVDQDSGTPGANPVGLQVQIVSATAAIPEPGSLSLFALAGGFLIFRRKTQRA